MTQLPDSMRYIEIAAPGGPEVMRIGRCALPVPGPGDVLIRVAAAGVNRPDVQQRKGLYPPPPGASPILGLEAAGEVVALGAMASGFYPGHKVTALCNGGAYAEYVAVPAGQCLPWPHGFTALQAAALPENYFTVWANLFDMGHLSAGETLLVHGGTSGIGLTAIQLALASGAKVFATAGSAEKCAAIEAFGATAINYRTQDFVEIIATLTDNRGVDVVLDIVGAPYTQRNFKCLALRGRLLQVAFMQGSKAEGLDLLPIMTKRLTYTGSTMRPRTTEEKTAIAAALKRKVWPWLEAGKVVPVIDKVFSLEDAPAAHALMESSTHIGKIMLDLAG
ncbi:NAD(P)H-quinone oxidoreductase [Acidocella aquatica]|nr:NAD(P)H-quinone oxidoreductase [Acidocella aquatica]